MGRPAMRIALLTSSRADYGIYRPLIRGLSQDPHFRLKIIAFGTHLSKTHGRTIEQIEGDGFEVGLTVNTMPDNDTPLGISSSMGKTIEAFSSVWNILRDELELIICLGDRFEMFAAVAASVPFQIPVAHFHGGETTLGAIDNVFRHSLTFMAKYHFVSTEGHGKRVKELRGDNEHIYNVGALSLDNINQISLLNAKEFEQRFGIPIKQPVLVTYHPETVAYWKNELYVQELINALSTLREQVIITMPNADTGNLSIRDKLQAFALSHPDTYIVESFGTVGYLSCISLCAFMLGNSSSGIIEAASFGKYVINVGRRQEGREAGRNVLHCAVEASEIIKKISEVKSAPVLDFANPYGSGNAAGKVIEVLKTFTQAK